MFLSPWVVILWVFWADWPTFIFQLAAPDMIWHIYSGQCCFTGDGDIHLPSSGEVLLGLGKVSYEFGTDHTKHWGSYPWYVCQGPRPLKSESGRMEQWNVVSSYVTWTLYLVVSAPNSQGNCPMVRPTSPEDRRSIPKTPLKQHCPE